MNGPHSPNIYFFRGLGERFQDTLFVSDYIYLQEKGELTPLDQELGVRTAYDNRATHRYLSHLPEEIYVKKFLQTLHILRFEYTQEILAAAERNSLSETIEAVRRYDSLNPLFPNYFLEEFPADLFIPIRYQISPADEASILIFRGFQGHSANDIIRAVHRYDRQLAACKPHLIFRLCGTQPSTKPRIQPITQPKNIMTSRFPGLQTGSLPSVREDSNQAAAATSVPSRDAAKLNMLRRMRPPPFKYAWTFYHDRHSDGQDYENRLTVLLENIISLKPFWQAFNRFPLESLKMKDSVHFFKRGVRPVWEDPRNVRGGSWTFRVPKDKSDQFWMEVLLLAVGEQFVDVLEPKDDLCGLSLSTRFNSNLITIWNRDGANQKAIDGILDVVLKGVSAEIRPRDNSYYYKKHSEHQGFQEAIAKAQAEADQAAKAKMEEEGKIEEAKVTETEVAKQEKEELEEEEEAQKAAQAGSSG